MLLESCILQFLQKNWGKRGESKMMGDKDMVVEEEGMLLEFSLGGRIRLRLMPLPPQFTLSHESEYCGLCGDGCFWEKVS